MTKPYADTEVSAEKTQGQIDELLRLHKITDIRWTTTTTLKAVEFHHALVEPTEQTCYDYQCRDVYRIERRGRHAPHVKAHVRAVLGVRIVVGWDHDERERRRLMRVLWWMLKSKFEIVDAGLVVFEEEFMPHLTLGTNRRVYDDFKNQLEAAIERGQDLSAGIGDAGLIAIGPGRSPRD